MMAPKSERRGETSPTPFSERNLSCRDNSRIAFTSDRTKSFWKEGDVRGKKTFFKKVSFPSPQQGVWGTESPKRGGSYSLLIHLGQGCELKVGRLGSIVFPQGYYVYTGSARRGLKVRVSRHLRKDKTRLWWHIDYLLASPWAEVQEILIHPEGVKECQANLGVMSLEGAFVVAMGFGSSDCKNQCPSHLFFFPSRPNLKAGEGTKK